MVTTSARVFGALLAAAMIASCNGKDVGNCNAIYPHARFCWEGVTRDSCDGQFTYTSCFELGYGCPDFQQFQAPDVCARRCADANLHLAECGTAIECAGTAPLGYTSCILACATVGTCEELQTDPLAACNAHCAEYDAGLPDRP